MMQSIPVCRPMNGRLVVLLAAVVFMTGCARTSPVAFYQLSADADGKAAIEAAAIGGRVIGIGPVRLPERLDRPQIITRIDTNRLQLSDRHRWIEPLAENISRVLRENLSILLETERFLYYPWSRGEAADYQLIIDVVRFEGKGYEAADLEAIWSIQDREGKVLLPQQRSSYQAKTQTADHEGLVSALSETLNLFCREIAQELSILAAGTVQMKT